MKKQIACFGLVVLLLGLVGLGQPEQRKGHSKRLGEYLGKLSVNEYDPDSISNEFGPYGSPYSSKSVRNPYSVPGMAAKSPYSLQSPVIIGKDGEYLGRLNRNRFDPESVANPYGVHGFEYSPRSVNNPYSLHGSPYSPLSAKNPYAVDGPRLYMPASDPSEERPFRDDPFRIPPRKRSSGDGCRWPD